MSGEINYGIQMMRTREGTMSVEQVVIKSLLSKYDKAREDAAGAYKDREFLEAHRLIEQASKAITNANKLYEKELKRAEKVRMQESRRGKGEEE